MVTTQQDRNTVDVSTLRFQWLRELGIFLQRIGPVLKMLFEHSTRPEFTYRHQWRLHDVSMWDNFSNMHFAVANYKAHGWRLLNRTTVLLEQ